MKALALIPLMVLASGCYLPTSSDSGSGPLDRPVAVGASSTAKRADPPAPADFTVAISITEQSCFGSAGCLVKYAIAPNYTGRTIEPGERYTVVYDVYGCDDPKRSSFEASSDGWKVTGLDYDRCSTPGSGKLTTEVVGVLPR